MTNEWQGQNPKPRQQRPSDHPGAFASQLQLEAHGRTAIDATRLTGDETSRGHDPDGIDD